MKNYQISIELTHCESTLHRDSKDLATCICKTLESYKKSLAKIKVIDIKT